MGAFRGKNAKLLSMVVAIAVVVVAAYLVIGKKKEEQAIEKATKENLTTVDEAILKNLDEEYPASVHEVINYYCEVLTCMFNGKVTNKEIDQLLDKERALFDKELLKANEYSEFVKGRYAEIKSYKKNKTTIIKYVVSDNDAVKYWQNNDNEMASVKAKIYMGGEAYRSIEQEYMLRKDDDDKWKILSWKNASEDKEDENQEEE